MLLIQVYKNNLEKYNLIDDQINEPEIEQETDINKNLVEFIFKTLFYNPIFTKIICDFKLDEERFEKYKKKILKEKVKQTKRVKYQKGIEALECIQLSQKIAYVLTQDNSSSFNELISKLVNMIWEKNKPNGEVSHVMSNALDFLECGFILDKDVRTN